MYKYLIFIAAWLCFGTSVFAGVNNVTLSIQGNVSQCSSKTENSNSIIASNPNMTLEGDHLNLSLTANFVHCVQFNHQYQYVPGTVEGVALVVWKQIPKGVVWRPRLYSPFTKENPSSTQVQIPLAEIFTPKELTALKAGNDLGKTIYLTVDDLRQNWCLKRNLSGCYFQKKNFYNSNLALSFDMNLSGKVEILGFSSF